MPMYPVWIHDKNTPKPDTPTLYEISANGVFLHKETPFWKAIVPVERISILEEQEPKFEFLLPPIPKEILKTVAQFFAWITHRQNTEALALLWWSGSDVGGYNITVPPQAVAYGRIEYDIPQKENHRLIGTLHSHGRMLAFHSSIDHHDEINFDGIHGTFGGFYFYRNSFNLSLQACINGTRFTLDPGKLIEGVVKQPIAVYYSYPKYKQEEYVLAGEEKLLPEKYEPPEEWRNSVRLMKQREEE